MIVTIHQPEFLPWLGFWDKMLRSDLFVLLDTVPFEKNYFQNRNRIRTAQGESYITVPVLHPFGRLIKHVEIENFHGWKRKILRTIELNYHRAPYFNRYYPELRTLFWFDRRYLSDFTIDLIFWLACSFNIERRIILASDLNVSGHKTELLLRMCRKLNASTYLSGISGRDYLDIAQFHEAEIEVRYQDFKHPEYWQCYDPFIPQMSGIDLLFNYGPDSLQVLRADDVASLS